MRKIQSIQVCILMILSSLVCLPAKAQEKMNQPEELQTYPEHLSSFYAGARGGYLFKNKDIAEDPAFYLDQGYFAELNVGWRATNNWLGWGLDIGRLTIQREFPFKNNAGYALNGYEVLQHSTPNWMWSQIEKDDRQFLFDKNEIDLSEKTDMTSYYAMTGPEFWFGKKKLQGFVSLHAGVGMTKFGHYFIQTEKATSTNTLSYPYYSQAYGQVLGPVDVKNRSHFIQYGMSQEDYVAAGSPTNFNAVTINDGTQINFMAKGTVGLEYFITPKLSLNASASYWYIMTPDWESQLTNRGINIFQGELPPDFAPGAGDPNITPPATGGEPIINGVSQYTYERDFERSDLGLISANIGIRYWFGGSDKPKKKKKEEEPEEPKLESAETSNKDLLITVKDKPTGLALSSVQVSVYKDGEEFYTGMTDVNGAVPKIEDMKSGNYTIKGMLNGIKTTVVTLTPADFEGDSRVIHKELLHNDLRFTLVGHTLKARTEQAIERAKTTLHNKKNGEDNFQTSNNEGEFRFQLNPNSDYSVYAEKKGYFSNRENISTKGLDRSKTLYVDLRLAMSKLEKGSIIELKNIYYDFDKANIRPDAAIILDDLYKIMIDNPTLVIELSSHTDSRGSDSYNMDLSQRRAESAVRYLVDKGINPSRLVARGYGETRLVNGCSNGVPCTDKQHQANRRTTIKILAE